MLYNKNNIAIIIPSYNEGRRISTVVSGILEKGFDKIIVVDDGSTDYSMEAVRKMPVTILSHVINRGAGAATETGLYYCREVLHPDSVVMIDADTQHDIEDIDRLLTEHYGQNADITIGNRFIYDENVIPSKNRFFNRIANFVTTFMAGSVVHDSQSGFKVFSKRALYSIVLEQDKYEYCSEIFIKAVQYELKIIDVPIKVYYPEEIKNKGQHFLSGVRTFGNLLYSMLFRSS